MLSTEQSSITNNDKKVFRLFTIYMTTGETTLFQKVCKSEIVYNRSSSKSGK